MTAAYLTPETGATLVKFMRVRTRRGVLLVAHIDGDRVVFSAGGRPAHSLYLSVSTKARVRAHWRGFLEAHGIIEARPGDWVSFPSSSMPSGYRSGRVLAVGPLHAIVRYRFQHGRMAAPRAVRLEDLVVDLSARARLEARQLAALEELQP